MSRKTMFEMQRDLERMEASLPYSSGAPVVFDSMEEGALRSSGYKGMYIIAREYGVPPRAAKAARMLRVLE